MTVLNVCAYDAAPVSHLSNACHPLNDMDVVPRGGYHGAVMPLSVCGSPASCCALHERPLVGAMLLRRHDEQVNPAPYCPC